MNGTISITINRVITTVIDPYKKEVLLRLNSPLYLPACHFSGTDRNYGQESTSLTFHNLVACTEAYSEPCQTCQMDCLVKNVNG